MREAIALLRSGMVIFLIKPVPQLLKSSMLAAQATQLKELDAIFERDNKEMKSNQAKVSQKKSQNLVSQKVSDSYCFNLLL